MKKMSLQWRLTCIITVYIAVICGCLTMLVYKNGVYYIDSLKETVDARGDEKTDDADETVFPYSHLPPHPALQPYPRSVLWQII